MVGKKYLYRVLLLIGSILFSIIISYRLAEKYFFDQLFFNKSIAYGYLSDSSWDRWNKFDKRIKYLDAMGIIDNKIIRSNMSHKDNILGITARNNQDFSPYRIAVIGDSFVWGMGVKENDLMTIRLESRLNKHRKAVVIPLGYPGNSLFDYLERYVQVENYYHPDLYIFVITINDILLHIPTDQDHDQDGIIGYCQERFSQEKPVYSWSDKPEVAPIGAEIDADKLLELGWNSPLNLCILEESLKKLPKEKAIYFLSDVYNGNNKWWSIVKSYLSEYNLFAVSSEIGKYMPSYAHYWDKDPASNFRVSLQEYHPNKLAHQMYADILFNEIISKKSFGFSE